MASSRLDRNTQELLKRKPELRKKYEARLEKDLGLSAPQLSAPLLAVNELFWRLRRRASSESGISLSLEEMEEMDPILLSHLLAMDQEFMVIRAKQLDEQIAKHRK